MWVGEVMMWVGEMMMWVGEVMMWMGEVMMWMWVQSEDDEHVIKSTLRSFYRHS